MMMPNCVTHIYKLNFPEAEFRSKVKKQSFGREFQCKVQGIELEFHRWDLQKAHLQEKICTCKADEFQGWKFRGHVHELLIN